MCLHSIKPKQVADKDIYTLKFANNYKGRINPIDGGITKKVVSYYQYTILPLGELLKVSLGVTDGYKFVEQLNSFETVKKVSQGFHSLINFEEYKSGPYLHRDDLCIILCVIPKGSEYYIGVNGDIASNQIILKEVIYNYGSDIMLDEQVETFDNVYDAFEYSKQICESYGIKIGL